MNPRAVPETLAEPCPLCRTSPTGIMIEDAPDYITNDAFQVLRCKQCDLGRTVPRPTDMSRYYPLSYRSYGGIVSSALRFLYRLRVRQWTKMFGKSGRALEVGCGPGTMLKALRDAGWTVRGIERTPEAAAYGRTNFGLDISVGWEHLHEDETFDLIILFQVLEHLEDPLSSVEQCFHRLRPGGVIVLGVPNIASWQAQFGREDWQHLDVPRHLFHFSPVSLTALLQSAGFENVELRFSSFEHDPFGWIQTIENKILPRRNLLLRYLMRLEPLNLAVAGAILLAGVLALPSIVLSLVSWTMSRGAILSAIARVPQSTPTPSQ